MQEGGTKNQVISMREIQELAIVLLCLFQAEELSDRSLNASRGPGFGSGVDDLFPWSWQELKGKKIS